jgi:hypothetical protein
VAFGGRKKKRLNRVFDDIGFVYLDCRYPLRGQKRKKMKVLTHRPRYIEPAIVPKFVGEASSATEAKKHIPAQKTEG